MSPTHPVSAPDLSEALAAQLQLGCRELGLEIDAGQQTKMLDYLALLIKWNKAYNLTAVRDPALMVSRHLLDSLSIATMCHGQRLIDVGTGAGLPGVVLGIFFPSKQIHLLDSNGKKTRFLFQVKTALSLDNMTVHHARVESFEPEQRFDAVISRAFATLLDMVNGSRDLLADGGHFLAMKGVYPSEEITEISGVCDVQAVHPISVPGVVEQRHLVDLTLSKAGDA